MGDNLCTRIIQEVAKEEGVEPSQLDFVLQEYVDTDGLRLLAEHPESRWTLSFAIPGYEVTITSQNEVTIEEIEYEVMPISME